LVRPSCLNEDPVRQAQLGANPTRQPLEIRIAYGFVRQHRDACNIRVADRVPLAFQTQWRSGMSNFNVGFVIFPDLTQLDFTGPLQVLARLPQSTTHIIAKSDAPVPSDCGLSLVPTCTFANCPPLDLICVPGGVSGVVGAIGDRETVEFVRRQAGTAKYVTSVCTGAFVLGVAGLLQGRRATTHWAYTDLLSLVGATYEKARVVKDGNVITAGGVTSGIDFGLSVVAEIAGETTARAIQLGIEYDPAPPFDSGHPDRAPAAVKSALSARYEKANSALRAGIEQAAR